jgi:VanZ family protein
MKLQLPVIKQDKANHFIYGCVIYSLSSLLFTIPYSLLIVAVIAGLKELHDKYTPGSQVEVKDWIYTMLGCLPVLLTQLTK